MKAHPEPAPAIPSPPVLLFAAVTLSKGSGGIAELSRQVFRTLSEMHRNKLIRLRVHVLEDAGPQVGDDLFEGQEQCPARWFAGKRWKFALSLVLDRSDVQLIDHVGLARLPGLIPSPAARNYILLIHGVEIWNNHRRDYHRTARKAQLLIANSEYTARKARAHYPDLPDIRVCWPGKDAPATRCSDESRHSPDIGPHAMLIAGRLSAEQRHKGHDHLIEVMPLILKTVPDAQLVIAGGGNDLERLQAKVQALNIPDRVIFTGWLDEAHLSELYSRCALFVMPSVGDGFGLVFLEAMLHRLPCVGLKNGAAAEIFEDGISGVLVDREDQQSMAHCLSGLLLDEPRRTQMGRAAFERYRSLFSASHYVRRLQAILLDYLHNGTREPCPFEAQKLKSM